jgi:hypothetical protein
MGKRVGNTHGSIQVFASVADKNARSGVWLERHHERIWDYKDARRRILKL